MGLTLKEELRRAFELATLRREAKDIRTPRQWAQADALMTRSRVLRDREERLFAERYDMRVEATQRRLIDAAGTPPRILQPRWIGLDRFDASALLRQAQRDVHAHHDRRISRIKEAEARALEGIVRHAAQENAVHGIARDAFQRAADQRHIHDRRRRTGPSQD
ncbi:hypothetical protein [Methylobacterium marchantiae]|uniref:Flagellar FliJ protein n=1 Tax=Methylobacterium marchantiae TaxID=600331 RepID=A0ABW3WYU9_9HYPH